MSYSRGAGFSKHDPDLGVHFVNFCLQCPVVEVYFSRGGAGGRESQMSFLIWFVSNTASEIRSASGKITASTQMHVLSEQIKLTFKINVKSHPWYEGRQARGSGLGEIF